MGNKRTNTPPKFCLKCGAEFNRRMFGKRLEAIKRWNARLYCSKQCNYIRPVGSSKGYYHRTARKYLKDNCSACETTFNLQVHHIDKDIHNNDPSNLVTMCGSCHMKMHWENGDIPIQYANLKRGNKHIGQKPK